MPLLHPQIVDPATEILAQSGLVAKQEGKTATKMSQRLDDVGLSREDLAFQLKMLVMASEQEQTKLSATKLALELHGELKSQGDTGAVNIIFNGADAETMQILIPR